MAAVDHREAGRSMQTDSQHFLSSEERQRIATVVAEMERQTSGEIVPLVVAASHSYPTAIIYGAALFSLTCALPLAPVISGLFWIGHMELWFFLALFFLCYPLFHSIISRYPALKRLFLSRAQIEEEVREAAITHFFTERLYKTREENGILLYISILERRIWILADAGINSKVPQAQWREIIEQTSTGIKDKRQCEAICEAITRIGAILHTHFPIRKDDQNELENLILR